MTQSDNMLARLSDAVQLLSEIKTIQDAQRIIGLAEAARVYAQQSKLGAEAQNYAAEIKLRAERKAGEILAQSDKNEGGRPGKTRSTPDTGFEDRPKLADLGISRVQSSRWQAVAAIPSPVFERHMAAVQVQKDELTTAGLLRAAGAERKTENAPAPIPRPVSVVETDQEALATLLGIHAVADPRILDVTHNRGRMWAGVPYRPHRSDRDPDLQALGFTDTVADFRALPFEPGSFDVLVFDPPHVTDSGSNALGSLAAAAEGGMSWNGGYGLGAADVVGDNIAPIFAPFLEEAKRVLVPGTGIVLAKIADQVHGNAYQWQHVHFINAAWAAGWTVCDGQIKVSEARANLIDPKWKAVQHVRGIHTYWLVLRNGPACRAIRATSHLRSVITTEDAAA